MRRIEIYLIVIYFWLFGLSFKSLNLYKILFFNTKLNKLDHNSFYKQDVVRKLTENEIEEFEYLKIANKYNL